jgi:hypothetical protein
MVWRGHGDEIYVTEFILFSTPKTSRKEQGVNALVISKMIRNAVDDCSLINAADLGAHRAKEKTRCFHRAFPHSLATVSFDCDVRY